MISNQLLEEIINISLRYRFIDKRILQKIFDEIFVGLDEYTKKIFNRLELTEMFSLNNTIAICNPDKGIILFDIYENYFVENENKNLSMLTKNLNIINNLLHEIEHLKQPSKMIKNDLEAKLLECSINSSHESYNQLYDYIPAEKIAMANARENLLNNVILYPDFKKMFFDEYRFISDQYIKNLKLGYYINKLNLTSNVPLYYYLISTHQNDKIELIRNILKKENNINIEEKFKFGLSVSKEDVKKLNKQKIKTKSII